MKIWKLASNTCAHLSIVWSLMLLTFYITDRYNPAMAFIDHDMTKGLIVLLSLTTLICVGELLFENRKNRRLLPAISSILAGLSAPAALILIVLDYSMVKRFEAGLSRVAPLLFTNDYTKGALALLAVTSIAAAISLIVLHRSASE
ncbi:MAG: hypothetical protein J6R82_07635 [Clostridia bacterium]|nr:hypothetical protein [Clostridia bacterium]